MYCKPKYRAILLKIFQSIIPFYLSLVNYLISDHLVSERVPAHRVSNHFVPESYAFVQSRSLGTRLAFVEGMKSREGPGDEVATDVLDCRCDLRISTSLSISDTLCLSSGSLIPLCGLEIALEEKKRLKTTYSER